MTIPLKMQDREVLWTQNICVLLLIRREKYWLF